MNDALTTYVLSGVGVDGSFTCVGLDGLQRAARSFGLAITGRATRASLRAELQGQPTFAQLAGPMYGGPGIVRYETTAALAEASR